MLNRLYGWYGKRVVWGMMGIFLILVTVVFFARGEDAVIEENQPTPLPAVTIQSVEALSGTSEFRVIGTVRAVSEARLEAEAGGRVTAVNVGLGDTVSAGTVIASLENSRERAALMQAEAAYEAAEAVSLQSGSSLEEAKRGVQNAYRNAYTVVDDVVRSTVNDYFTSPDKPIVGFRLSGGDTAAMNETRRSIETILEDWSGVIATNYTGLTETELLTTAQTNLETVSNFVITLSTLVENEDNDSEFGDPSYQADLAGSRGALDGALASLARARQVYEQASLTTSNTQASQTSAQLRSALATMRSAQANFERTLVRSPISGVVNALYLKTGEYVNQGQPAAVVANNNALEISTALGEADLRFVSIGDAVSINGDTKGIVTKVAPAIDPLTGKGEVLVSVATAADIKNGSTVSIAFVRTTDTATTGPITVPLTALRLLPTGPIAYAVNAENTLVAIPVTLGDIVGDTVTVLEGLSSDTEIITDARGRRAGETVTVTR